MERDGVGVFSSLAVVAPSQRHDRELELRVEDNAGSWELDGERGHHESIRPGTPRSKRLAMVAGEQRRVAIAAGTARSISRELVDATQHFSFREHQQDEGDEGEMCPEFGGLGLLK